MQLLEAILRHMAHALNPGRRTDSWIAENKRGPGFIIPGPRRCLSLSAVSAFFVNDCIVELPKYAKNALYLADTYDDRRYNSDNWIRHK